MSTSTSTSTIRLVAGVAAALTFTAAGGATAAVAAASPGFDSPSGHSRDGGHSRGHQDDPRRERGPRGADRPGAGTGRGPSTGLDTAGRGAPSLIVVEPALSPAQSSTSGESVSAAARAPQAALVSPPPPIRTGHGGATPVTVAPALVSPRVVVGNGRPPASVRVPVEPATPSTPEDAVVQLPPSATPVASPALAPVAVTVRAVPTPPFELPAPPPWTTVTPSWPTGAIFGIAGLLLAPLAGMWLGHRQARASKSASQLVSR